MQSLFRTYSAAVYFILLTLCSIAMVWGNFPITLSCIVLVAFWVLDANYLAGLRTVIQRKTSLFFLLICLLFLVRCAVQFPDGDAVSLFVSKLPFLVYIIVLGSKTALPERQFHALMLAFLLSIVVNTMYCFGFYLLNVTDTQDFREIGVFMSHIRLALFAIFGLSVSIQYLFYDRRHASRPHDAFLCFSAAWLLFFLIFSKTLIAYVILGILATMLVLSLLKKYQIRRIRNIIVSVLVASLLVVSWFIFSEARYFLFPDKVSLEELDETTAQGNPYNDVTMYYPIENGHRVNIYICAKELDSCWKAATNTSIYDRDSLGYRYVYTICRYMASKNLRKDAEGFAELTGQDIENIKNGFANHRFNSNLSVSKRIYESFWEIYEYLHGANPSGHSITQRIVFQECALKTVQRFPWFGAGCKIRDEIACTYQNGIFLLVQDNWNHLPHNQFLYMAVMTGLVGLAIFLVCIIGMVACSRSKWNAITIGWFVAMLVSFFSEDTMNSHVGLVFCAYLGALVLFAQPEKAE